MNAILRQSSLTEKGTLNIISSAAASAAAPLDPSSDSYSPVKADVPSNEHSESFSAPNESLKDSLITSLNEKTYDTHYGISRENKKPLPTKINRHTVDLSLELASLDNILKDLNDVMPESVVTNSKSALTSSVSLPPKRFCTLENQNKLGSRRNKQGGRKTVMKSSIDTDVMSCNSENDKTKENIAEPSHSSPISSMTNIVDAGIKEIDLNSKSNNIIHEN